MAEIMTEIIQGAALPEGLQTTATMAWFAEQMPGGFFIYRADEGQQILYVNQATCRMFGCETTEQFGELTGNTFRGMVHPDDFEEIQASIDAQIADSTNLNMDYVVYRIIRRDGTVRWVDDYGHYATLPGYGNVYYVFIGDITEKRIAQEEAERNRLLQAALQEAERANVAKTAFLSNMSHEIRTPMNAILGLDSIALRNPDLSEETREQFVKIGASARHLLSLINDILDMSRIESGRMTIRQEEFAFGDMLEQINTMIGSQCDDKGLDYECRIVGHVDDYYVGDDMKLKQVIINILGNAVKFTDTPGNILFTVEELERNEHETAVRFTMKDSGIGMDADYLPRLFEAFTQEQEGADNKYGSSGLGMAITKNIVDMMQGTIQVTSEKGVGTEFVVTVRLGVSTRESERSGIDPKELRVLIVDDDVTACEHASLVLNRLGAANDYCMSADEALAQYEQCRGTQNAYNLILTDWKMPECDGVELIRRFRRSYPDDETTVILTTYNWDDIMEEALKAGVDGFLGKPFFAKSMREQLAAVMSESRPARKPWERTNLAGRRVLLAEDMLINAEIMIQILKLKGMEADHAVDGVEAVSLYEKNSPHHYDAILMDIRMPKLGGLDAARQIRASGKQDAAAIPIIALTADAFDEDVKRSLEAGMNAHLSKPVEPDALFETLATLITD